MSALYAHVENEMRIGSRRVGGRESMLALAQLALSLSLPTQKPAVASKQFRRVTSVLPLGQPTASAVDVVNVLGRWDTYAQVHRVAQRAA